jgi:transcriptional antiterminator RfaH
MPWHVIYTKSRNEKKVEKLLLDKGIEAFCPTLEIRKQWSDRIKIVIEPMFRSYCFVNIEDHQRELIYSTPGFTRFLFWLKKPAIVKDKEIDQIKEILNIYNHDQISLFDLKRGQKINIASGIFENTVGEVINNKGKKIKLLIEEMGMIIEVDPEAIIYQKLKI